MSKVRVTADANGNIIGVYDSNPELGWVRVEQTVSVINDRGWLKRTKRSGFIKGKVEELAEENYQPGQELPGRIIVKESFVPFNEKNPESELKIAGDSGVICRVDDQPIYRQSFYVTNENAQDELIMHTNSSEIKEVLNVTAALNKLAPSAMADL